eukprot:GCRY01001190.1.p1 GENE.GCRY01001190.1~~GCRY01001190.1.p1  ORF type:complete len:264 (-),score=23.73 GCRY01001190.1:1496-2287(-)
MKPKIVLILGTTGVGKTKLSVGIAQQCNGEIVNADSMQVYKGLDIGTAKASLEEQEGVPHHLLSFLDVWEEFSVLMFQKMAREAIDDIVNRGKTPIVCGGTAFYIQALLQDNFLGYGHQTETDHCDISSLLLPNETPYEALERLDTEHATKLHPKDLRKVLNSLEAYKRTGLSQKARIHSAQQQQVESTFRYVFKREKLEQKEPNMSNDESYSKYWQEQLEKNQKKNTQNNHYGVSFLDFFVVMVFLLYCLTLFFFLGCCKRG